MARAGAAGRGAAGRGGRAARSAAGPVRVGVTERVLRYPGGHTRVIRYPEPEAPAEAASALGVRDPRRELPDPREGRYWLPGLEGDVDNPQPPPPEEEPPARAVVEAPRGGSPSSALDSPAALLQHLRAEEEGRRAEEERVRGSFEVHSSCPWLEPREVWVVVSVGEAGEGSLFTMRARQAQAEAEDELNKLLKHRRPGGGNILSFSKMCDGVLAFRGEEQALACCDALELAGVGPAGRLDVVALGSHELFRMAGDARAVVVVLKEQEDGWVPDVRQLRSALGGGAALEELM